MLLESLNAVTKKTQNYIYRKAKYKMQYWAT